MSRRIAAIPTIYNGVRYRSKLEADWARAFDDSGIGHAYEPEGWRFGDGLCYLPDFYLPDLRTVVEVKGMMDRRSALKIEALERETSINGVLFVLAEAPAGRRWAPVGTGGVVGAYRDGFDICPYCLKRQFFDDGGCRLCPRIKRVWDPPYTPEQWRECCRWWAREMVRAGRMDDAAVFTEESVRLAGAA